MSINASVVRARFTAHTSPLITPEHRALGDVAFTLDGVSVYMDAAEVRAMVAHLTGALAELDAATATEVEVTA